MTSVRLSRPPLLPAEGNEGKANMREFSSNDKTAYYVRQYVQKFTMEISFQEYAPTFFYIAIANLNME